MAVIRLYKKFYRINANRIGDLYSLINPTSIVADTYLRDSTTIIESSITITKESDGVYYADLNPSFYSYNNIYDLKWTVKYLGYSPTKILITSFKLNPINISGGGEIYAEIENQIIETEIQNQIIEVIIL